MKEYNTMKDIQKRMDLLNKKQQQIKEERKELTKSLDKRFNKNNEEVEQLQQRLKNICTHLNSTKSDLTTEGGYLNKGYTDYFITCNDCGKVLKTWREEGDYA